MSRRVILCGIIWGGWITAFPNLALAQGLPETGDAHSIRPSDSEQRSDDPPLDAARLRDAAVEIRSAWQHDVGYLVGDRRTVAIDRVAAWHSRARARMLGSEGPWVRISAVVRNREEYRAPVFIRLEADLSGEPLQIASRTVVPGERVWRLTSNQSDPSLGGWLAVEAIPTPENRFSVIVEGHYNGALLLDDQGDVIGFLTVYFEEGTDFTPNEAIYAEHLIESAQQRDNRRLARVILGAQIGLDLSGVYDAPATAGVFDMGASLWDHLGLVVRVAFSVGNDDSRQPIPATSERFAGVVETHRSSVHVGYELRYRLLLRRSWFPLYVDFVGGIQWTRSKWMPSSPATYSTEPGCEPFIESCPITSVDDEVSVVPDEGVLNMVGPVLGVDFRFMIVSVGYRLILSTLFHDLPPTHQLHLGISAF